MSAAGAQIRPVLPISGFDRARSSGIARPQRAPGFHPSRSLTYRNIRTLRSRSRTNERGGTRVPTDLVDPVGRPRSFITGTDLTGRFDLSGRRSRPAKGPGRRSRSAKRGSRLSSGGHRSVATAPVERLEQRTLPARRPDHHTAPALEPACDAEQNRVAAQAHTACGAPERTEEPTP